MLSKGHPEYEKSECDPDIELIQLETEKKSWISSKDYVSKGLKNHPKKEIKKTEFGKGNFTSVFDNIEAIRKKYETSEAIPDSDVP